MIYVPNFDSTKCYENIDNITIREYDSTNVDSFSNVIDYNTGNHYIERHYTTLVDHNVNCIDNNILTDNIYYRNDFAHIFIVFILLFFVIVYFPYKLITRFYKRGGSL